MITVKRETPLKYVILVDNVPLVIIYLRKGSSSFLERNDLSEVTKKSTLENFEVSVIKDFISEWDGLSLSIIDDYGNTLFVHHVEGVYLSKKLTIAKYMRTKDGSLWDISLFKYKIIP